MKTLLKTLLGGAVGALSLYIVGSVAYKAGHDMAELEQKAQRLLDSNAAPSESEKEEPELTAVPACAEKKASPRERLTACVRRIVGNAKKTHVLRDILRDPDGVCVEAHIENGAAVMRICPRAAPA